MNNLKLALVGVKKATYILKIPEPEVYFIESKNLPNKEITGIFVAKDYEIIFNEDWVLKSAPVEVLVNCFHETRHAYQLHSIKEGINESKATLEQWKSEFESYNNPTDDNEPLLNMDYLKQSIELDAIRFAHVQMKNLFGVKTIIPDPIKHLI